MLFNVKNKIATKNIIEIDAANYFDKYLHKPVSTMFEVIQNRPVKPYFDYDEEVKSEEQILKLRNKRIKAIHTVLKGYYSEDEVEILVFDASGYNPVKKCWKLSFRAIINNYGVYESGNVILQYVIPQITKLGIKWDDSVYKTSDKMQLLGLPYHCKEGNENRFFQKVDLTKNNYPIIEKSAISSAEFESYFVQNNMSTSGKELESVVFESNSESEEEAYASDSEEEGVTAKESGEEREEVENDAEKTTKKSLYSYDDIAELVACLNFKGQEWHWDKWFRFVCAMHTIADENKLDLKNLVHEVSRESVKYDKKYTDAKYNIDDSKVTRKVTIATIIKWAVESNPQRFKEWNKKRQNKKILYSAFSDADFAEHFLLNYPNTFQLVGKQLYHFTGVYWKECSDAKIFDKLNNIYDMLMAYFHQMEDNFNNKDKKKIYAGLLRLRNSKALKAVLECIKMRIEVEEDRFDCNEDLLGFTNGTYDLKTDTFRNPRKQDYISKIIPYDYEECSNEELKFAEDHFKQVLPDKEVRDLFFTSLSSGLRGRTLQKFIIWTGSGANSKGVTQKIVRTTFGENLYGKGNNSVLTQETKGDLCQGIATMNNKRIITYEEPSVHRKIVTNMMKELTGGDIMAYRAIYSPNMKTNMRATHIMMCNDKPLLDKIDDAVSRRLLIIPFESLFKTRNEIKYDIPEGTPNVFEARDGVEDAAFLERMKLPFLHLLLRYYRIFRNSGYQITNVPDKCRALAKEYMAQSDEFTTWFNDTYEFTNDNQNYVRIADVYQKYKDSELYQNLDKKTRRLKGTKKVIIADIQKNPTLKMYFRERLHTNDVDVINVIIRYRERVLDDEDEE